MKIIRAAIAASFLLALAPVAGAEGLPNGATSLNETFNDWSVGCRAVTANGATTSNCAIEQVQVQKNTRKRVLSISFLPQDGGGIKGTLVLPFGLDLAAGVKFRIDSGDATAPIPFKTCMPVGCLIPIDWKAATANGMRNAAVLKIETKSADGKDTPFTVSLKGFGGALDRAMTLTGLK